MKTSKITFVIDGQEPIARSIFAFEAFTNKQKESFNNTHRIYVCKNLEGIFFSKNLSDAAIFENEDSADNIVDMLSNTKNMNDCDWNTILLIDGIIATEEQLTEYSLS